MTDDIDETTTDFALLDRYHRGECSAAERRRVERWLAADPSRGEVVRWMGELQRAGKELPAPWNPDRLWERMREELASREPGPAPAPARQARKAVALLPRRSAPAWSAWLSRLAAVVALAVGVWSVWRMGSDRPAAVATAPIRTFETKAGERATFQLADGSRVILGASSRLEVPTWHRGADRDVFLTGQGYFEVARDPGRPFRVHGGGAVTRVLGTKFGVEAFAGDSVLTVVVAEGSVAIEGDGGALTRGDLARRRGGRVEVEHGVDVSRYLAWTEGRLEFVNRPLREVIPHLERWYGLDIRLADSALGDRLVTATIAGEGASEALTLLARSLALRLEQQGDGERTVTLFPK